MADFDSIVNVEEWISDYFLTSDEKDSFAKCVDKKIKQWKDDAAFLAESAPAAPFAVLTSHIGALQTLYSELESSLNTDVGFEQRLLPTVQHDSDATLERLYAELAAIFGYGEPAEHTFDRGNDELRTQAFSGVKGSMALLYAQPISASEELTETRLLNPILVNEKDLGWSTHKSIGELFYTDTPPEFVVTFAGPWVILASREAWPLGRYLAINLGFAVQRADKRAKGELAYIAVMLAKESVEVAGDGTIWWAQVLEASRESSVKVSGELRAAIKASIEIIGNDVLDRHRARDLPVEDLDGNELARQSLRYLYRILFLLFAESSPELEILPTYDPHYVEGYGLARLRELIVTEPTTPQEREGTHLYDSLQVLFNLINVGHDPYADIDPDTVVPSQQLEPGLTFRSLSADLFQEKATAYINRVQLSNIALFKVLQNLLLTKERKGKDRGYISYATLGVTELGQVYEGLMSYTGFIAQEDLYEVAPGGNPEKGSWVVAKAKIDEDEDYVPQSSFIVEKLPDLASGGFRERRRAYPKGSFVYRQSSRDRERSASFYTPPVLTEFTVGQAIEELQASGRIACADDVLTLSVCEPAMGSGAFAVEAVNQLANLYLELKQEELGVDIPAEDRVAEFQKVKAYIALHQVHGVDLNATAVELAEISLWLDTMTADLKAPWFGLHLRHGNSLVGATRSTFDVKDLKKRDYLKLEPKQHSVQSVAEAIGNADVPEDVEGRVHHFLVPSQGWGATAESKDLKALVPDDVQALKDWRKSITTSLNSSQIKRLQGVARRVEWLWQASLVRLRIAEDQARRDIKIFGQEFQPTAKNVKREDIEKDLLFNEDGSYRRLRLAMDLWNALWFWPVTKVEQLPDLEEWISTLEDLLGVLPESKRKVRNAGTLRIGADLAWDEIATVEDMELSFAGAKKISRVVEAHPWVKTAQQVAAEQAFFHWDLDFAVVMSRGGFDLQVGNPPWVRPDVKMNELLAEVDPWFVLAHKPTQAAIKQRREPVLKIPKAVELVTHGIAESVVLAEVLDDVTRYPYLKDQRPDLYRGFMNRTWANNAPLGVVGLIHPESHFTEKKAAPLRRGAYLRLRRHWQFINSLKLFDVHDLVKFGVHVYGAAQEHPSFLSAASLYYPQTVVDSLSHDGTGKLPGIKNQDDQWDLRPHRDRIITVGEDVLETWNSILEEPGTPLLETRTVYTVNSEAFAVLRKLADALRIKELGFEYSLGWNETTMRRKGYFDSAYTQANSWDDVILQGPHIGVSTPMIKQPNPTLKHNQDWSEIDLEAMGEDFLPATAYQILIGNEPEHLHNLVDTYRVAWRRMAATTGFRTLYPSVIPPGAKHVDGVFSMGSADSVKQVILVGASLSSFLVDYQLRATGVANIFPTVVETLPSVNVSTHALHLQHNYLRLNCLTRAYAPLWEEITGEEWTPATPARNAKERFHLQNEIDAMVALSLGITLEELLTIYRTQFPVMYRYDQEDLYDANGRKVPKEVLVEHKKNPELTEEQRAWVHPQSQATYVFEYPFAPLDREADLTAAYHKFQGLLQAAS